MQTTQAVVSFEPKPSNNSSDKPFKTKISQTTTQTSHLKPKTSPRNSQQDAKFQNNSSSNMRALCKYETQVSYQ